MIARRRFSSSVDRNRVRSLCSRSRFTSRAGLLWQCPFSIARPRLPRTSWVWYPNSARHHDEVFITENAFSGIRLSAACHEGPGRRCLLTRRGQLKVASAPALIDLTAEFISGTGAGLSISNFPHPRPRIPSCHVFLYFYYSAPAGSPLSSGPPDTCDLGL